MSVTPHSEADEREAIRFVERIEAELFAVLARQTQYHTEAGAPRFGRWLAIHAVGDLLGRLLQSAIELEGDDAQQRSLRLVRQLELHITPGTERPS